MALGVISFNFDYDDSSLLKKLELAKKMIPTDAEEDVDDDTEDDFSEHIHFQELLNVQVAIASQLDGYVIFSSTPSGHWKINTPPPKF